MPLATSSPASRAEQLRGPLLERPDGWVLAEDVVTDLGLRHRPAHGRGGLRDGIGTKIDHGWAPGWGRWRRVGGESAEMRQDLVGE